MRTFLEKTGRFCARRHWIVIAVWLVIVIGVVLARASFGGTYNNDFTVPGSSSQQGSDVLKAQFPAQSGYAGQIVFAAPPGTALATNETAVNQATSNVAHLDQVLSATGPFAVPNSPLLAPGGTIGYATVNFAVAPGTLDSAYLDQLNKAVQPARSAGLTVEYGGAAGQIDKSTSDTASEIIGLACALVLLLFMFGSLVAAAIPLVSAIFSVLTGLSVLALLAAAFTFPTTAPTVATLLGLGVAVDYGLFLVARHRENVDGGMPIIRSAGRSNAMSGSAIVVAGTTVIIAILGLFVAGVPFISALGVAAATVVAVTMLASLTLVPAFLGLARGSVRTISERWTNFRARRAGQPPAATIDREHQHENSMFGRWGRFVSGRPWPWAIGSVIVLVIITIPLFFINFGQLDSGTDPTSDTDRRAYDLIAQGFGPGANGPLTVIVSIPPGQSSSDTQTLLTNTQQSLAKTADVASVWPPQVNPAGNTAILNVIPKTGPQSDTTNTLVNTVRDAVLPQVPAKTYLTGTTAGNVDFTDRAVQRLPILIGAVVLLSLLLLTTSFRSLAIGLKAAVMNLLSVGAAYGVVVAVFQWGWGSSIIGVSEKVPIPAFVPMLMFAIVFGLSMDYEVFLLSRVHETYLRTHDAHRSVAIGIGGTARVITTAASVMIVVFISFVANPDPTVKMLAVGMAVSVLIDASLVRMILVPAVMSILGDRAWWVPRWLDRILPRINLEGAAAGEDAAAAEPSVPVSAAPPVVKR